jgi:hypothetical protein
MSKDNRLFKAATVRFAATGWVADLSPREYVSEDFYYLFALRRQAKRFLRLVDSGVQKDEAYHLAMEA